MSLSHTTAIANYRNNYYNSVYFEKMKKFLHKKKNFKQKISTQRIKNFYFITKKSFLGYNHLELKKTALKKKINLLLQPKTHSIVFKKNIPLKNNFFFKIKKTSLSSFSS